MDITCVSKVTITSATFPPPAHTRHVRHFFSWSGRRLRSFLKKPLRPVWLSPETRLVEGMLPACPATDLPFTPVICVSASKVRRTVNAVK